LAGFVRTRPRHDLPRARADRQRRLGDTLIATDELATPWGPVRLVRGLLGIGVALLFLWVQRQIDVLMWSSGSSATRDDRP
jgi:hypothetical protein